MSHYSLKWIRKHDFEEGRVSLRSQVDEKTYEMQVVSGGYITS